MMSSRPAVVIVLACIGLGAAGCSSTSDIIDSVQNTVHDFNPFGTAKKPLPGERKVVFPEGVPGVEQGIPPHLMQGQQQIPDPNAPAVIAAPPEPPAAERAQRPKPKPTRTARPKPAPPDDAAEATPAPQRPARARRQAPTVASQPGQPAEAAWPAPAQQQPPATQWPAPAATQPTGWPDPPKAGTFTR
jgi:outer membrane biosynthesis protein TonB